MYSAYIDNFLNAKDAVRIAKEAKPAFHKFLEVSVGLAGRPVLSERLLACVYSENWKKSWEVVPCLAFNQRLEPDRFVIVCVCESMYLIQFFFYLIFFTFFPRHNIFQLLKYFDFFIFWPS